MPFEFLTSCLVNFHVILLLPALWTSMWFCYFLPCELACEIVTPCLVNFHVNLLLPALWTSMWICYFRPCKIPCQFVTSGLVNFHVNLLLPALVTSMWICYFRPCELPFDFFSSCLVNFIVNFVTCYLLPCNMCVTDSLNIMDMLHDLVNALFWWHHHNGGAQSIIFLLHVLLCQYMELHNVQVHIFVSHVSMLVYVTALWYFVVNDTSYCALWSHNM